MKPKLSFALGGFFKGDDDDDEGDADDDDDDGDVADDDEGSADNDDIGADPLDLVKSGSPKKSPFLNGKNDNNNDNEVNANYDGTLFV